MAKRLEMTAKLKDQLTSAVDGINPDEVAVYEVISINALPVSKKGSIFEGAVHTGQTLREMADAISARPMKMNVPLHMNHDQGYGMPVGKTFHGGLFSNSGVEELRSLIYLPLTETETLAKLDTGTIDEVSIGARYQHLNCSACGWDYLGVDATSDNIWSRTCANEHQIGSEGVHLMLNGLDRWMEQSLVSLGAANNAKILSRTRALLGETDYNKLAATGSNPAETTLYASATKTTPPKDDDMDLTELVKELTKAQTSLALSEAQVKTLTTAQTELTAKVTALETEKVALTAKVEVLSQNDAVKTAEELKAARLSMFTEAKRLAVAAGVTPPKEDAPMAEFTESIDANRKVLTDRFSGKEVIDTNLSETPPSAFKTRK